MRRFVAVCNREDREEGAVSDVEGRLRLGDAKAENNVLWRFWPAVGLVMWMWEHGFDHRIIRSCPPSKISVCVEAG